MDPLSKEISREVRAAVVRGSLVIGASLVGFAVLLYLRFRPARPRRETRERVRRWPDNER